MFDKFWDFYDYLLSDNDYGMTLIAFWMIIFIPLVVFCVLFFKKFGRKRLNRIVDVFMYSSIGVFTSVIYNWWFAAILCVPFFFLGKALEKLGWEADIAMKRIEGDVNDMLLSNKIIIPSMAIAYLIAQLVLYIARVYEIVSFQ